LPVLQPGKPLDVHKIKIHALPLTQKLIFESTLGCSSVRELASPAKADFLALDVVRIEILRYLTVRVDTEFLALCQSLVRLFVLMGNSLKDIAFAQERGIVKDLGNGKDRSTSHDDAEN
jgi:hypothetical protein